MKYKHSDCISTFRANKKIILNYLFLFINGMKLKLFLFYEVVYEIVIIHQANLQFNLFTFQHLSLLRLRSSLHSRLESTQSSI